MPSRRRPPCPTATGRRRTAGSARCLEAAAAALALAAVLAGLAGCRREAPAPASTAPAPTSVPETVPTAVPATVPTPAATTSPGAEAASISAAASASAAAPPRPAPAVADLRIQGPTLVVVLPPAVCAAPQAGTPLPDDGSRELRAHVDFALADTLRCLGDRRAAQVLRACGDAVTLRSAPAGAVGKSGSAADARAVRTPERVERFDLASRVDGLGVLLAEPGRPSRLLPAAVGPSALTQQLPQAASEFWNAPLCRRG